MLSDNIRAYRKKNNLSQDELAERIGVSRQSVSFWENGQTQPTIDNIIALSRIFNISTDVLLGNADGTTVAPPEPTERGETKKKGKVGLIITVSIIAAAILISLIVLPMYLRYRGGNEPTSGSSDTTSQADTTAPVEEIPFDLFTYWKNFAIENGKLNGDYCIYQQPAARYGGYENEYISVSYWSDSDMVEFCLHCPLDETYSHNFYLRMRGGYDGRYEYASSKYYRDTGESLRLATGYIDPSVFSYDYPIPCDQYYGSADGQDQFMEDSRVGICDLIRCIENFVIIEKLDCDFSVFGFVNF